MNNLNNVMQAAVKKYIAYTRPVENYAGTSERAFRLQTTPSGMHARVNLIDQFESELIGVRRRLSLMGLSPTSVESIVNRMRGNFSSKYGDLLANEAMAMEQERTRRKQARSSFLQGLLGLIVGKIPTPTDNLYGQALRKSIEYQQSLINNKPGV